MSGCGNCSDCGNASGCAGCSGCGGCASSLELTEAEIDFLRLLGQVAFLPVARKLGDETPVCLEDGTGEPVQTSLMLQCLEKKMLISLDYAAPLKGADMGKYQAYPVRGSVALTRRGQQVLELLEIQGCQES